MLGEGTASQRSRADTLPLYVPLRLCLCVCSSFWCVRRARSLRSCLTAALSVQRSQVRVLYVLKKDARSSSTLARVCISAPASLCESASAWAVPSRCRDCPGHKPRVSDCTVPRFYVGRELGFSCEYIKYVYVKTRSRYSEIFIIKTLKGHRKRKVKNIIAPLLRTIECDRSNAEKKIK